MLKHRDRLLPVVKAIRTTLSVVLVAIVLAAGYGCSNAGKGGPSDHQPPPPMYLDHTVRYPGETLAIIAKHYTGKETNYRAILDANPGLSPNRIRLGQVIRIPRQLLITDVPLPSRLVRRPTVTAPVKKPEGESGEVESGGAASGAAVEGGTTVPAEPETAAPAAGSTEGSEIAPSGTPPADVPAEGTSAVEPGGAVSEPIPSEPSTTAPNPDGEGAAATGTVDSGTTEGRPAGTGESGSGLDDAERERLLDELLR